MHAHSPSSITHLVVAAIGLLPVVCYAAKWELVSKTEKVAYYLDLESIVSSGRLKRVWLLENGHDGHNEFIYTSRLQLRVINCSERSVAVKQYVLYALPDGKGEPLGDGAYRDSELDFLQVVPGSIGERILRKVCN